MDIRILRDYCLSLEDTSEKMPFGSFAKKFDSILVSMFSSICSALSTWTISGR